MRWLFTLGLLFNLGCTSQVVVRDVILGDPIEAWVKILKQNVDVQGNVDFTALAKNPRDLEGYLTYIARTSPKELPEAFSDEETKIAYYLNVHNAWAMYSVVHHGLPEELGGPVIKVDFFYRSKFSLGGDVMSIAELENEILRPIGDPRILLAMSSMARGGARLRAEPLEGARLEEQLQAMAKDFYNDPRNVRLDDLNQKVYLTEFLKIYEDDFLKKEHTIVAYVNQFRTIKIPDHYPVEFVSFDWRVARQSPKP